MRPETTDQKYGRFRNFRWNQNTRRKPIKAGMETANQIPIQTLASCIGERKMLEH